MSDFRYVRPDRFPPITKNLIIINVLVWVAQLMFDDQYNLTNILALHPIDSPEFKPYQIATHMFAHASYAGDSIVFYHILFNMFSLWMFGRILENYWGPKRFLLFYLICGVGAAACHLLVQHIRFEQIVEQANNAMQSGDQFGTAKALEKLRQIGPAVGASGAIMGILAGFAYLFPNTPLMLLFFPVPIKAKWFVLFMAAIDLYGGFSNTTGDNIAHFAHLGGALTGFIIVFYWNKSNRRTFY